MNEDDEKALAEAEAVKAKLSITATLDERIEKLERNQYQYASAGDTRMLIAEVKRLRALLNSN